MSQVKARQLAIDTRLKLGLQSTERLDVCRAVTSLGVTRIKRPLESSISGATLKTDKVKLILINSGCHSPLDAGGRYFQSAPAA